MHFHFQNEKFLYFSIQWHWLLSHPAPVSEINHKIQNSMTSIVATIAISEILTSCTLIFLLMILPLFPFLFHYISHITHCLDMFTAIAQLFTKSLDMHINGSGFPFKFCIPYTFHNHFS